MWVMSHQYYCTLCCCSTDSWSVTTCLSLKLHNKFRIFDDFPSLFSLIYGDEATWTKMLVYSAEMLMAHVAFNHFTCHPGKHKYSWHAMGGWCLYSGSWDQGQKNENCRALWLPAGKRDSTLKFIVTSPPLFPQKNCPKTLLPHSFPIMAKTLTWFQSGPVRLSYCTVH